MPSGGRRPGDRPALCQTRRMPPEKLQWKHLYDEVVTSGLCTGCAGCVIACPHDVLGYHDTEGIYKPFQIEEDGGPDDCSHGEKGCTSCTRACPRFRAWEPEIDEFLFGRARERRGDRRASTRTSCSPGPPTRCSHEVGQDGGLVSAILLYCARARHHRRRARELPRGRRHHVEGDPGRRPHQARTSSPRPGAATPTRANTMAYADAVESGAERIALVGMSCQCRCRR